MQGFKALECFFVPTLNSNVMWNWWSREPVGLHHVRMVESVQSYPHPWGMPAPAPAASLELPVNMTWILAPPIPVFMVQNVST